MKKAFSLAARRAQCEQIHQTCKQQVAHPVFVFHLEQGGCASWWRRLSTDFLFTHFWSPRFSYTSWTARRRLRNTHKRRKVNPQSYVCSSHSHLALSSPTAPFLLPLLFHYSAIYCVSSKPCSPLCLCLCRALVIWGIFLFYTSHPPYLLYCYNLSWQRSLYGIILLWSAWHTAGYCKK